MALDNLKTDAGFTGTVKIADDVVAIIAGLAATEVKGVASMAGNIPNELIAKLGMKKLSKGVKIEVREEKVTVSIPETTKTVQIKVKDAIENMTGLSVEDVNVRVAGIDMQLENDK